MRLANIPVIYLGHKLVGRLPTGTVIAVAAITS